MKKIFFLLLIILSFQHMNAQGRLLTTVDKVAYGYPPTYTKNGTTFWCGRPIDNVVKQTDFIFEGKVLSVDSIIHYSNGVMATYNHILVLKQFKGNFISDTMIVVVGGDTYPYTHSGDVAFFFTAYRGQILTDFYGEECGLIPVCNNKDIETKIYEVIETVTGQKYIEVHPNNCATQKKK